jgi:hypothetical protein
MLPTALHRGNTGGRPHLAIRKPLLVCLRQGKINRRVQCIDAASQLVNALTEHHAHSDYFKFSADGWFTFGAFAAAFMIKVGAPSFLSIAPADASGAQLLCPQAAPAVDNAQRQQFRALVIQLISAYSSVRVAIDEQHTPSIYARFLSRLLRRADELNGTVDPPVEQALKLEVNELFGLPMLHTIDP